MNFVNNFNAEWRPVETVMVRARVGVGKNVRKADKFLSPQHTSFDLSAKNQKGSYTSTQNDTWYYDGEFTATFGKLFADVHHVNADIRNNFLILQKAKVRNIKRLVSRVVILPVRLLLPVSRMVANPNIQKP